MSTITLRVTGVCSGGNHYTVAVSGDFTRTFVIDAASLQDMGPDDVEGFVKSVIFLAKRGRTGAQVRTLLQTGVTVTV